MFPFKAESFNNNFNLAVFVNLIIYIAALLIIPIIIVLLIAKIKPRIKKSSNIYLYALSAGMLLIIGTVGFIKESYDVLGGHHEIIEGIVGENEYLQQLIIMLIVGGGAIIGITTIFITRWVFLKMSKSKEMHKDHHEHDHHEHMISFNDVDNPKAAWVAILLLLAHRTIDGFILGATVSRITAGEDVNIGLIITFNIHIIIEILIIYYRQIQYGQSTKKAVIYNLLTTVLLIPIMFISAFINKPLQEIWWILPIVNASGGAIITFVAVIELVPEFIHLRNNSSKEWYVALIFFAIGIIVTLMMLAFHNHSHDHGHSHELLHNIIPST